MTKKNRPNEFDPGFGSIYATLFAGHMQYLALHYDELKEETEYILGELYYSPIGHADILYNLSKKIQQRLPELKTWPAWNYAVSSLSPRSLKLY